MYSRIAITPLAALARLAAEPPPNSTTTPTQGLLSGLNLAFCVFAVAVCAAALVWWAVRGRRNPLTDAPPRVNRLHEDAIAMAVLAYLVAMLVLAGVMRGLGFSTEDVLAALAIGNGAQLVGIAACLVIAAGRFEGGTSAFLIGPVAGLRRSAVTTVLLVFVAIGLCPIALEATMGLVLRFEPAFEFKTHATINALHEGQPIWLIIGLWTGAAVVAPVAEELFFRGLLQTFFVRLFGSRWAAVLFASTLFGLVHYPYPHTVPALIMLGVVLGYSYERTGSLLPPIVIHALFNLKALIFDTLDGVPM